MPVKLRLKRQGRSKRPHYAIVAADSRAPRDGRFIEKIGTYNPLTQPGQVYVDHDLALKWLQVGAQPTNTVRSLLRHAGVTLKFALIKQGKDEETMGKIFERWEKEKRSKKKKKLVMVDNEGRLLEETPVVEKPVKHEVAPALEEKPEISPAVIAAVAAAEEVAAEAAPEVVEEVASEVIEEVAPEVVEEAAPEVVEEVAPEAVEEATSKEAPEAEKE